mgnify:CR=1 FL=1
MTKSVTEADADSSRYQGAGPQPLDDDDYVDLQPLLNRQIYLVDEGMAASKVYSLFRTLGLRHIYVIQRPAQVMGIISRKDLLPDLLHARFPSDLQRILPANFRSPPPDPELHHSVRSPQQPNKAD